MLEIKSKQLICTLDISPDIRAAFRIEILLFLYLHNYTQYS